MKKFLFTLALIVSVFALSAQGYVVTDHNGAVVQSGASYYIYGDGAATYGELNIEFEVTATENVVLIGEKVEEQVVESTMNWICFGQCLLPTTYVTNPNNLPADSTLVFSMHYMYTNEIYDVAGLEQIMKYYIYPESNPDDKFIFNVVFKYSLEDVDDYSSAEVFSNAYPVPAIDVVNFDYNFTSDVNAEVAIYNLMGQEVMRSSINGMSGKASLNVSDLTDGVYFYSLIVNGVVEKSNKLIIKK